jgi:hypothetical protein
MTWDLFSFTARRRPLFGCGAVAVLLAGAAVIPTAADAAVLSVSARTALVSTSASVSSGSGATNVATAVSSSSGSSSSSSASASSGGGTSTSSSTVVTSSGATSSESSAAASCTMPTLSEPFAGWGDTNEYAAVPGNAFDTFTGTGWTLSNGASIGTSTLSDGTTGSVLDLPAGATAVSPPMCVQYDYPDARMMIENPAGTDGVALLAAYAGSGTQVATGYSQSGEGSGWNPSQVLETHPGDLSGWQVVQFTLEGTVAGTTRIYNFYVDPRMSH